MDFNQKILLSLISALIGFLISQTFNIVKYFRRPKFRASKVDSGVLSSYTGDPPLVPSEVVFGFYLENFGKNPAKNTRVFLSGLKTSKTNVVSLDDAALEFSELKRPIDLIPSGQKIIIILGRITSDMCYLNIPFQDEKFGDQAELIELDTRNKKIFEAQFKIYCDDINSATTINLTFDPSNDEWNWQILSDM